MTRFLASPLLLAAVLAGVATPAAAQSAPSPWRPVRVAKWTTAGITVGAALYGFANNQRADAAYEELEAMCQADRQRCASRAANGSYNDPTLESEYQRIRRLDRRARTGLLVGQVAVGASVALFILDLRNDRPPPNIPYEPRGLRLAPARDGGIELSARWRL